MTQNIQSLSWRYDRFDYTFQPNECLTKLQWSNFYLNRAFIFNHKFVVAVNKSLDKWGTQSDLSRYPEAVFHNCLYRIQKSCLFMYRLLFQ
jgi:hypothetical protein